MTRYARQMLLSEIGGQGQARLTKARVLVVGVGGIGCPVATYLAAAGVGHLVLVDDDSVEAANLNRQTLFTEADIGAPKVDAGAKHLARFNSTIRIQPIRTRITPANAQDLMHGCDVVVDGSDSLASRHAVSDGACAARVPLVSAAVRAFEGQVCAFRPWERDAHGALGATYRCLAPDIPLAEEDDDPCRTLGVLGAITGIVGTQAALETIKQIVGFGDSLTGKLWIYDGLRLRARVVALRREGTSGH